MKSVTAIFLFFITSLAPAQNKNPKDLGIGFAVLKDPYEIGSTAHPNIFYQDKNLTSKISGNLESLIFPFFYKPDYGLYHFVSQDAISSSIDKNFGLVYFPF